MYRCLVCGFKGLPQDPTLYKRNYALCVCCGFEYGFDDYDRGETYASYRGRWVQSGLKWYSKSRHASADWNAVENLAFAEAAESARNERIAFLRADLSTRSLLAESGNEMRELATLDDRSAESLAVVERFLGSESEENRFAALYALTFIFYGADGYATDALLLHLSARDRGRRVDALGILRRAAGKHDGKAAKRILSILYADQRWRDRYVPEWSRPQFEFFLSLDY